jgi:hypothetical protein
MALHLEKCDLLALIQREVRPESAFAEDLNIADGMPPAFRNNLLPIGCDNPASSAASSLLNPAAIARQNLFCSSRPTTEGRPGDGNGARPDRADLRLTTFIASSKLLVLRRPFESAQYVSIEYTERLAEAGIEPSVGSVGDSYDNALAETINGLYKAEVIYRRGPWRSFEAVEFATLEWVDWFNNRRLLEPIGNSRRPKPSNATTPCWNNPPWRHNLNQIASGKPGAVHFQTDVPVRARSLRAISLAIFLAISSASFFLGRPLIERRPGLRRRAQKSRCGSRKGGFPHQDDG